MLAFFEKYFAGKMLTDLFKKLGPVPNAIKDHLNVEELVRIAVTSFISAGGSAAVLPALLAHVDLFVDPTDVGVVTAVLTLIIEIVRRLEHGTELPAAVKP